MTEAEKITEKSSKRKQATIKEKAIKKARLELEAFPPEPQDPSPEEQHMFSASVGSIDHVGAFEQHQQAIAEQQAMTLEQAAAIHAQQLNDQISQHNALMANQEFFLQQPVVQHNPLNDAKPYRCDYEGCDKSYKKLNGLISHHYGFHTLVDLKDPKPYRCGAPGCDKQYRNTNGLAYHLENSHSFGEEEHPTREPGTFFPSIHNTGPSLPAKPAATQPDHSALVGDLSEIPPEELAENPHIKAYPCYMCEKIFRNGGGLSYHLTITHPPLDENLKLNPEFSEEAIAELDSQQGGSAYKCALCLTDFDDYKRFGDKCLICASLMGHMALEHDAIGGIEYVSEGVSEV